MVLIIKIYKLMKDILLYFKGKFWAVDTMFYAICNKNVRAKFIFYIANIVLFIFRLRISNQLNKLVFFIIKQKKRMP